MVDAPVDTGWPGHRGPQRAPTARQLSTREQSHALFDELADPATSEKRRESCREELVQLHLPLVDHCARRFTNRGEPLDDLVQVGTIGLIKSVDRFDNDRGVEFSTYATPTILGEIKRYFRDKGWAIRVPRRLQELRMSISAITGEMSQDLGRSPTPRELAEKLGVSVEEVMEGLESANAYSTLSLDAGDTNDDVVAATPCSTDSARTTRRSRTWRSGRRSSRSSRRCRHGRSGSCCSGSSAG